MACFANFNFQGILFLKPISSLVFLVIQIAFMILLEGFLVRLMIGITKNSSRRIINATWMSKRMGLKKLLKIRWSTDYGYPMKA